MKMALLVKLTYDPKSDFVPIKCLLDELTSQPSNNIALRLPKLTKFSYYFFFQPSQNLAYADYFVVKLSYNAGQTIIVDPAILFSNIQTALNAVWEVSACGKTYFFSSKMNKDLSHSVKLSTLLWVDSYSPSRSEQQLNTPDPDLQLIPATTNVKINSNNDGLWLTTTFFCNQIQLYGHEFKELDFRIYIVNPGIYLGDGEYRIIPVVGGEYIVKVCVDQYLPTSGSRCSTPLISCLVFGVVRILWFVT